MTFLDWANKWGVPTEAVQDYYAELGADDQTPAPPSHVRSEADVSKLVQLEASAKSCRLWRNNVGAGKLENGSFVRWGLCNESEQMNRVVKSSDLIGIRPIQIQQHHIGTVIGQFMAREVKAPNWKYSGKGREAAQLAFIELVASLGGDAAFANGEGSICLLS